MNLARILRRGALCALLLLACLLPPAAQAAPGISRAMRETEHFQLAIDKRHEARLDSLAALCEAAWNRLATATGYRPKRRIQVVFHDEDDYSNGWAMASTGWVNIWLTPSSFDLRGGADWSANVISHELAHVFTLQALGKDGYFLGIEAAYGRSTRDAEVQAGTALSFSDLEAWLAEGLAQVGAEACGADGWDAYRDQLERVAWHSDRILSDGLLRSFWGDPRESEQIYNQGYSFMRFVLSKGAMDLPTLLATGRRLGLRQAIEGSLAAPFPQALDQWRGHLASRHGAPDASPAPGRVILPPPSRATWVRASSPLPAGGTRWTLTSRSNDYGLQELWSEARGRILADASGRLRLSPAGDSILVLREKTWPDRRIHRDLWLVSARTGKAWRITRRARVADADFLDQGFLAVLRSDTPGKPEKRNRLAVLDSRGHVLRFLPDAPRGEWMQVAADPAGRHWAVAMGGGGYRLWRLDAVGSWQPAFGDDVERRDPTVREGTLWFSRLEEGRWVAARASGSVETIVARAPGGLFEPFPMGDSLLVTRYGARGYETVVLAAPPAPPAQPIAPPVAAFATPAAPLSPSPVPYRRIKATPFSLAGWFLQAGLSDESAPDMILDPGAKWVAGGGALVGTPSMETLLELGVTYLHGAGSSRAEWDPGFRAALSTEAFAPRITLEASYQEMTARRFAWPSSTASEVPPGLLVFAAQTVFAAEAIQTLDHHWSLLGAWSWASQGMGFHGFRPLEGHVETVRKEHRITGGIAYENMRPGRHGPLSGLFAVAAVTRALPEEPGDEEEDQPVAAPKPEPLESWNYLVNTGFAANLNRILLLETEASWELEMADSGASEGSLGAGARLGLPLPISALSLPFTRHARLTFVDPILHVGVNWSREPPPDGLIPTGWLGPRRVARRYADIPAAAGVDDAGTDDQAAVEITLGWKALTLANRTAQWRLGAALPFLGPERTRDLRWIAMVSL